MVPSPRSWLRGPVRALREHRALALFLGLAVGTAALVAAEYYAHPSLYEYFFLPFGVGGCTYYLAHYDLSEWQQDGLVRAILRNWAMISVPMTFVPDDLPLADGIVTSMTVFGVIFFAVLTAVVDVVDAKGDDAGGRGRVDESPSSDGVRAVDAD